MTSPAMAEVSAFHRSVDIWFKDGNVVLVAQGVAFKVFGGILAQSSPVFADMFEFPQPAATAETMEGCSIVHMPDSAEDLRYLLVAITDPR